MNKKEIVQDFAKILVQHVRDKAIQSCNMRLRSDANDIITKRWRNAAHDGDLESIANVLIPDIVDDALFHLLRAIDQEVLQLTFKADNGDDINLDEDGELAGKYIGPNGWRYMYSTEKIIIDDLSELE